MNTLRAARTLQRVAASRGAARGFSSSAKRHEYHVNVDRETFEEWTSLKHTTDRVVLVDFYADWCNPCRMLSPILEKIAADKSVKTGSGRPLDLITVDSDRLVDVAAEYKVRSLPTVFAFKDGKPVSHFIGAVNEAGVRQFIETL